MRTIEINKKEKKQVAVKSNISLSRTQIWMIIIAIVAGVISIINSTLIVVFFMILVGMYHCCYKSLKTLSTGR